MDRNKLHEVALARLSMTALAIDGLIVLLVFLLFASFFDKLGLTNLFGLIHQGFDFVPYLLAFVVTITVYLFIFEVVLAGHTIGRLCLGLHIKDVETGQAPAISHRFIRFTEILIKMGFTSLHLKKVPAHNKRINGALCSDWVDFDLTTVSTQTKRPRDKSKPVSTRVRGAFLKKLSDPSSGKIINVQSGRFYESKGVFYIGRTSERSDLVISSDNTVSRIHCRIVKKDTGFILADGENLSKGSTGGTFLNGRQLDVSKNYPLKHGDKIRIGQSELQFLLK